MNIDNFVNINVVSDETAREVYKQIQRLENSKPEDTTESIDEESKNLIQRTIFNKIDQLNAYYANVNDADLPDFMRQYRAGKVLSEIDESISNVNNILSHFKPKDDGYSISAELKEAKDHLFELESRIYGLGFAPSAVQKKAIEKIKNGNMGTIDIDDVFEFKDINGLSLDEKINVYRKINRELWKNMKIRDDKSSEDINDALEMINRLREYRSEIYNSISVVDRNLLKEELDYQEDLNDYGKVKYEWLLSKGTDSEKANYDKLQEIYSKIDGNSNIFVNSSDDNPEMNQGNFDYDSIINMIYDEYQKDNNLSKLFEDEKVVKILENYIDTKYRNHDGKATLEISETTDFDNDSIENIQNKTVGYLALAYNNYKNAQSAKKDFIGNNYFKAANDYLNMAKANLDWIDVRFKLAEIGDIILNDGDNNQIGPIVTDIMSKTGAGLLNDNHEYDEYNVQVGLLIIKRSIYNQMESIYRNKGDNAKADYYANIAENLRQTYSSLYDEYKSISNDEKENGNGQFVNENSENPEIGEDVKFNYSTFEYNGVTYYVGNDLNSDNILSVALPSTEAVMVNNLKPGENIIGDLPIIINMDENGQITVTKKGKDINVNNFNVLEENNSFDYLKFTSNGVDYYVSNNLNDDNISNVIKSGENSPCMVSGLKEGKNYIEGVDAVITLENGKLSIEGKGIENVSNNTYEDVKYVSKEAKKQVKKQTAGKDKGNDNDVAALAAGLAANQVVNESKPKKKLLEKLKESKVGRRIVAGLVAIGTLSAGAAYLVSQLKNEHVNQDITQTQEVNNDYQKPSDSVDSNKNKLNTDEKSTTISYNTADLSNLPVYDDAYDATSRQNPLQANQWFRYNFVDVFDTQTGQYMNLTKDQIKNPEVLSKLLDGHHAILCGESKENPSGFISVEDVYQSLNAESQAALDEAVSQANNTMHR